MSNFALPKLIGNININEKAPLGMIAHGFSTSTSVLTHNGSIKSSDNIVENCSEEVLKNISKSWAV